MKATTVELDAGHLPWSPTHGRSPSSSWPWPAASLLEQPLLEQPNFFEGLRAPRIHDEVRILRAHALGKEPNQSAGFQVALDERCTRQGNTEARNGRRKQQRLVAVPRSLAGVAVVQTDRFEPDRPGLSFIVKKRYVQEVAWYTRQPNISGRKAAYRNQLLVIKFDRYQPGPRTGAEPDCHVDPIAREIRQRQGSPDIHFDVRMTFNELREARQQPVCSETRQHTDGQDPVPVV